MDRVRKLILERVEALETDLANASRKMGRNHAYLHQFIHRGVPAALPEKAREELAPVLGVSADDLRDQPRQKKSPDTKSPQKIRSEVDFTRKIPIEPGERDLPLRSPVRAARVIGDVQAGVFREALEWPPEDQFDVMVELTPVTSRYNVFGLRVLGPSMNQEFKEGSIAICIKIMDLPEGYEVRPGQYVVVLRRNPQGPDEFEATIKEYHVDRGGRKWLLPRSDDPRFQTPIAADSLMGDTDDFPELNEDVRVWAVVVGQNKHYGV